jgi:hypothetical protein
MAAFPVAAGGAEGAHGGGVAAAFGGEVSAVAQHVRPAPEGFEIFVGVAAKFETGGDLRPSASARQEPNGSTGNGLRTLSHMTTGPRIPAASARPGSAGQLVQRSCLPSWGRTATPAMMPWRQRGRYVPWLPCAALDLCSRRSSGRGHLLASKGSRERA